MFRLLEKHAPVKWPVTICVPVDGGEVEKHEIVAQFKLVSLKRSAEIIGDQAFLAEVLVGWEGVHDADGNALPFTDENRERLCDVSYVKPAIVQAYLECSAGAARKNSKTRRATG